MTLGGVTIDSSTDDPGHEPESTVDDARPDQLESEMLFGETIAWMRPNAPLFKPPADLEPDIARSAGCVSSVERRRA